MPPTLRARNAQVRKIKAHNRTGSVVKLIEDHYANKDGTSKTQSSTGLSTATDAILAPALPLDDEKSAEIDKLADESIKQRERTLGSRPDEPPRFTIDMSLPSEERYVHVAQALRDEMRGLVHLFDDVLTGLLGAIPLFILHFLCKMLLRRVHSNEEMGELRGIAKVTGLQIYLLVTFNVLLDMLLGCSSGGALVGTDDGDGDGNNSSGSNPGATKMMHFRTLDWGMTELRSIVVRLDFVEEPGQPPFASSISYAGYVGTLTGVRKGLSLSLNFRRRHIGQGQPLYRLTNLRYIWHKLAVLLGLRPGIASVLRGFLLDKSLQTGMRADYASLKRHIASPACETASCYLTLCDGNEVTVFEKDRISAVSRSSEVFENVTNNDMGEYRDLFGSDDSDQVGQAESPSSGDMSGMEMLEDESVERNQCTRDNYAALLQAASAKVRGSRKGKPQQQQLHSESERKVAARFISTDDIVRMVQHYPTTNEDTHYAAVMDPSKGEIVWCRRWKDPIEEPDRAVTWI